MVGGVEFIGVSAAKVKNFVLHTYLISRDRVTKTAYMITQVPDE